MKLGVHRVGGRVSDSCKGTIVLYVFLNLVFSFYKYQTLVFENQTYQNLLFLRWGPAVKIKSKICRPLQAELLLIFIERLANVHFPRTSKRFENSDVIHAVCFEQILPIGSKLRKTDCSQRDIKQRT